MLRSRVEISKSKVSPTQEALTDGSSFKELTLLATAAQYIPGVYTKKLESLESQIRASSLGGGTVLVCSFTLQLLFFVSLFFENATQLSIGPSIIVYHAKDKEYVSLLDCTIRLEGFYENNKRKARNRIYERTYRVRQHEKVKLVNEPYFLTVCCFLFLFPDLRQLTYSASMPIVSGHNERCSTTLIHGVNISSSGQKKLKTFYLIIKCCGVQG